MTREIYRADRGGCWLGSAWSCHSAFRSRCESGVRLYYLGFRPVFRLKRRIKR